MKKLLILALALLGLTAQAQLASTEQYGQLKVAPQSADYSALFESMQAKNAQTAYETFRREFIVVPEIDAIDPRRVSDPEADRIYTQRLRMMATEIQLPYNDIVQKYIEVYTKPGGTMERVLGLAQYYFPIFEEALFRHGLPMEFKILPVIESALIPAAKSRAAAVGLWQMMILTGKYYGLEVSSFVDERCDPVKSTDAACRFLKDLYRTYGDWTLVLAAYNCGPGNVNKAIKRAGGNIRSYWDIWEYLPRETRSYVPTFIGASYGYTFQKTHGMQVQMPQHPITVDTVMVGKMMHFNQVSSTIDVPIETLRALNPQYRIDIVPAITERYPLILPTGAVGTFIDAEQLIYSKDTTYLKKYLQIENFSADKAEDVAAKTHPGPSTSRKSTTHTVKSGDILGKIAGKYNVKVADIQKWNKMKGTNLRIGQKLTIYR